MQSVHHVIAAAVLFAASWLIRAWQAYRSSEALDGTKAGYIAFDQLESQVRHPFLLLLWHSRCVGVPQLAQPRLRMVLGAGHLTGCAAGMEVKARAVIIACWTLALDISQVQYAAAPGNNPPGIPIHL